ncbi:MAG: hypothetical protein ACR2J3_08530, partial [Aridibacter sp.]
MQLKFTRTILSVLTLFSLCLFNCSLKAQRSNFSVYIRFKVNKPASQNLNITIWGYKHEEPWYFPKIEVNAKADQWSEWINLTKWDWHGKVNRSGGLAEYPAISLIIQDLTNDTPVKDSEFEVQLADSPSEKDVVISFTEQSNSDRIIFLAPYPLRENAKDFETATQRIDRQTQSTKEATDGKPPKLEKFQIITNVWNMNNA